MKILVVCQYYYPEPFRIPDICEELVRRGHQVTVVTGVPNYPEGVIYPGYEKGKNRRQTVNDVEVHRCWTISRKTGALYRLLNYYSFAVSSSLHVRKLPGDFDVVFVNQLSPVMMACAGITYGKKNKKPVVMYCLDLWPESLIAGGIRRGSLVYKLFHWASKRIYTRVDKILVTSCMFTDYLSEQFGIRPEKMEYLPQYAEGIFNDLKRKEKSDVLNLTLAGNIGEIQSVETVLKAAALLRDEPVRFHIVGGGTDLGRLQGIAREQGLDNVVFYGRRPLEEMPGFYTRSDAMLVTLKADPVLSLTLPGKVQSYMAAGKPIIGAINGETARVIAEAECGFCSPAEDADALAKNIKKFLQAGDKQLMGQRARAFYESNFTQESFVDELEKSLREIEDKKSNRIFV